MITFDKYATEQKGKPSAEVAAVTNTPVEIIVQYETFIKYQTDQAVKNNQPVPTTAQLVATWNRAHSEGAKSITTLSVGQFEDRIRRVVREELQRR